jgi:hypothetical protein
MFFSPQTTALLNSEDASGTRSQGGASICSSWGWNAESCENAGEDSKQQSNRTLETFLKIKVAFCKNKKSLGVPMDTRAKPRLLRSI